MTSALSLAAAILLVSYSNIIIKLRATQLDGGAGGRGIVSYLFAMAQDPLVWTAVFAFGSATILWLLVVRRIELSVAQPVMAMSFVTVPVAAAIFLGESLPPLRIVGLIAILLGVFLVARTG